MLIFILLSVAIYRETLAAAFNVLTNEQITTILNELREKVNTEELKDSKFEATIANLEHEMETVKDKSETNKKLIIKEINQTKDTLITVDRLEKMSRTGTSCSNIANLGNLESGTYLLDIDGKKNEAPFEAFCKMPERTTFVGDDTTYDFENCNDSFCSETLITYKAPKPQLDLLVKKSPSCRQTIVFNCQSSPIMTFEGTQDEVKTTSYLQWKDNNGQYHNITGGTNCNKMWPQMRSDSFELNDSTLLPISAVRYGPMEFEWQKAKILVSKLQCDPYDEPSLEEQIDDIKNSSNLLVDRMDTFEDRLVEVENNVSLIGSCPHANNYRLVKNKCYYFEKSTMTYQSAQRNCKSRIPFKGRLFEPHTVSETKEMYDLAKSVLGNSNHYWIGLDSFGRGSNGWQYASDGSPKTLMTHGYNGLDSSSECAVIRNNNGYAEDVSCNYSYYSICESHF